MARSVSCAASNGAREGRGRRDTLAELKAASQEWEQLFMPIVCVSLQKLQYNALDVLDGSTPAPIAHLRLLHAFAQSGFCSLCLLKLQLELLHVTPYLPWRDWTS